MKPLDSARQTDSPRDATDRDIASDLLLAEADAIRAASELIDEGFDSACGIIERSAAQGGALLVSGIGKSGLVGGKISATFASLGVPSHSVHPTEAAHGDLGRFRKADCCLCLSNSGETEEVVNLASILRQDGVPIIAMTRGADPKNPSTLERLAEATLRIGVIHEAGGMPAPTSSTTVTLALGDALAIAVARRRGFTSAEFARHHPGGSLGQRLRPIMDVIRSKAGATLALIDQRRTVRQALEDAATPGARRPGAMLLVDTRGVLAGIFTDGDLRRLVRTDPARLDDPISDVMTQSPRCLPESAIVDDALRLVRELRSDEIPVIDADGRPVGLLDVQDLVALKLISD